MPLKPGRFAGDTSVSLCTTFLGCMRAVKTVIWTPPHNDRVLHTQVAKELALLPLPVVDSFETIVAKITEYAAKTSSEWPRISSKERLGLFAVLMQFTMYIPEMQPYYRVSHHKIRQLHEKIIATGRNSPVSLADQLQLALNVEPAIHDAVWLLFTTSRQYARWYDSDAITDMPALSRAEVLGQMKEWSKAIGALKKFGTCRYQDSAGDVYYVWTHALAKLIYGPMSPKWAFDAWFYKCMVHIGTKLNHTVAHRISPQSIESNHTIASVYGNAIGKVLASNKNTMSAQSLRKSD